LSGSSRDNQRTTVTQGFDHSTSTETDEVAELDSTDPSAIAPDAPVEAVVDDEAVEDVAVEDAVSEDGAADDDATEAGAESEPVADALQEFKDRLHNQIGDWYVVHTYSGMEKRVKSNLENRVTSLNAEDYIFEVVVPTEEVAEIKNGQRKL